MNVWFTNASYAGKPRTMHLCNECGDMCHPGIGRNRLSYIPVGEREFVHGYFHVQCFPRFLTRLLREHRDQLKAAKA